MRTSITNAGVSISLKTNLIIQQAVNRTFIDDAALCPRNAESDATVASIPARLRTQRTNLARLSAVIARQRESESAMRTEGCKPTRLCT